MGNGLQNYITIKKFKYFYGILKTVYKEYLSMLNSMGSL